MMVLQAAVLVLSFLFMGQVQAQEATQMNMEILKEKIKADKKLVVASKSPAARSSSSTTALPRGQQCE